MIWLATGGLALAMILWILARRAKPLHETPAEVAKQIEDFCNGTGGTYDWDDFISFELADPFLESVRLEAITVHAQHPPLSDGNGWCDEAGVAVLRQLAAAVREYESSGVAPVSPNSALHRT